MLSNGVHLQKASVENEKIYAALNGGQSVILAMGLTSILIAAATSAGSFTAGDLVRISSWTLVNISHH